jgi:hypothetical protein
MATKKKTKKKPASSKKPARKKSASRTIVKKSKAVAKKKPAAKKAKKKHTGAKKAAPKKASAKKVAAVPRNRGSQSARVFSPRESGASSAGQSGDLQGLYRPEAADSESVDELVEEGNAFEADAVLGVENADDNDEQEVHTHEVPEDDVPGEYLDEE